MANPEIAAPSVNGSSESNFATLFPGPPPGVEKARDGRGRKPYPRDAAGNVIRPVNSAEALPPMQSRTAAKTAAEAEDKKEQAKFLGLGFVSLMELAESFVHTNCAAKIAAKIPSKLDEFKAMAQKLGLQPEDKEIMSNSIEKIAERHDWMTRFAPEVLLAVSMSQYGLRQMALMRFTNNVTKNARSPDLDGSGSIKST